jgi:hypothetical protein
MVLNAADVAQSIQLIIVSVVLSSSHYGLRSDSERVLDAVFGCGAINVITPMPTLMFTLSN